MLLLLLQATPWLQQLPAPLNCQQALGSDPAYSILKHSYPLQKQQ